MTMSIFFQKFLNRLLDPIFQFGLGIVIFRLQILKKLFAVFLRQIQSLFKIFGQFFDFVLGLERQPNPRQHAFLNKFKHDTSRYCQMGFDFGCI